MFIITGIVLGNCLLTEVPANGITLNGVRRSKVVLLKQSVNKGFLCGMIALSRIKFDVSK